MGKSIKPFWKISAKRNDYPIHPALASWSPVPMMSFLARDLPFKIILATRNFAAWLWTAKSPTKRPKRVRKSWSPKRLSTLSWNLLVVSCDRQTMPHRHFWNPLQRMASSTMWSMDMDVAGSMWTKSRPAPK